MVKNIYVDTYNSGHIQGIAIDNERKYMYCSFTTELIKFDMQGNKIASVKGLHGHLGCIAFNPNDGKVYGSLEYKHDSIGKGILKNKIGVDVEDGFYIAIFDVEKMTKLDLDAECDGIMTAVYLKEVTDDYNFPNHRYGCSGIDGTSFAPDINNPTSKLYLYVAYGIYGDVTRDDNDNQIILKYDIENWDKYKKPLNQQSMHRSGPEEPDNKYFVYTGNTEYGIQNLEYDREQNAFIACVYKGKKEKYPNYSLFLFDLSEKTYIKDDPYGIKREFIKIKPIGIHDEKTGFYGFNFRYGSTGIIALGGGKYYISHEKDDWNARFFTSNIKLYEWDGINPFSLVQQ